MRNIHIGSTGCIFVGNIEELGRSTKLVFIYHVTTSVIQWSEFLATDPDIWV
jgi:hypothetical protein